MSLTAGAGTRCMSLLSTSPSLHGRLMQLAVNEMKENSCLIFSSRRFHSKRLNFVWKRLDHELSFPQNLLHLKDTSLAVRRWRRRGRKNRPCPSLHDSCLWELICWVVKDTARRRKGKERKDCGLLILLLAASKINSEAAEGRGRGDESESYVVLASFMKTTYDISLYYQILPHLTFMMETNPTWRSYAWGQRLFPSHTLFSSLSSCLWLGQEKKIKS